MGRMGRSGWEHFSVTQPTASCDGSHSGVIGQLISCEWLSGAPERKLVEVNRIRTAVVLGTVLLRAATPVMACLLTGIAPTPAERECCHRMAAHCGQSMMPASHACCRVPSRPETVVVQAQVNSPVKHPIAVVPAKIEISLHDAHALSEASLAFSESPPDQPLFSLSSVLRI